MREITPTSTPWGDGRPYKKGDDAWPVVALQINLASFGNRLALDGVLGPKTEKVVKAFQSHRGLTADGVAGPVTQEWMCRNLAAPAERRYTLPAGLLRGAIENESSFMLAAYTEHPSDDGFDLGALQDSYTTRSTQERYRQSLNVAWMAGRTGETYRKTYDRYRSAGAAARLGWECAALYHNWPVAADRMAKGLAPLATGSDSPAGWVERASAGRLHTPREWADAYIAATTRYVRW